VLSRHCTGLARRAVLVTGDGGWGWMGMRDEGGVCVCVCVWLLVGAEMGWDGMGWEG
jgi:hypothetical protein